MSFGSTFAEQDAYHLHNGSFYICCIVGVFVFTALIYSMVKYWRSTVVKAGSTDGGLGQELFWATIPFVILVIMAIPATRIMLKPRDPLQFKSTPAVWAYDDHTIKLSTHRSRSGSLIKLAQFKPSPDCNH